MCNKRQDIKIVIWHMDYTLLSVIGKIFNGMIESVFLADFY